MSNNEQHDTLESEPLITQQPPKMKFDDFRYCFEGPNEKSLCGAGRYGAVHRVENRDIGLRSFKDYFIAA